MVKEGVLYTHTINPVLWTIAIELIASGLYPVFIEIFKKNRAIFLFVIIPFCIFLSSYIKGGMTISCSLHYLYMFMAGAALNILRPVQSGKWGKYFIGAGVALMLWSRRFGQDHTFGEDLISTISATSIIGAIAFSCPDPLQYLLGTKKFIILGRASYSYYLINPAILFTLVHLYPTLDIAAPSSPFLYVVYSLSVGLMAAAITIPLSYISLVTVENFSIKIGRNSERRLVASLRRYRTRISAKFLSEPPPV